MGVDGPLIGAAELAFEPMLADPAARLAAVGAIQPTRAGGQTMEVQIASQARGGGA
jgi:hypothetical protein